MAHYPADTFQEATEIAIEASNQLHGVINGDANAEVTVEDGSKIPSVRKAMVDSLYFKPAIAWAQGEYEDTYNQLREFVDGDVRTWWFAKGATVSTPVLMTTNPATDPNWTLWSAVTLNAATYETQKRLAAEAGLNMVGSFLLGGTVTNVGDVVFCETDGKYYGWGGTLPKAVSAGSAPATSGGVGAGAWVDRTDLTLRSEVLSGKMSGVFLVPSFAAAKLSSSVTTNRLDTLGHSTVGWGSASYIKDGTTGTASSGNPYKFYNADGVGFILQGEITLSKFGAVNGGDCSVAFADIFSALSTLYPMTNENDPYTTIYGDRDAVYIVTNSVQLPYLKLVIDLEGTILKIPASTHGFVYPNVNFPVYSAVYQHFKNGCIKTSGGSLAIKMLETFDARYRTGHNFTNVLFHADDSVTTASSFISIQGVAGVSFLGCEFRGSYNNSTVTNAISITTDLSLGDAAITVDVRFDGCKFLLLNTGISTMATAGTSHVEGIRVINSQFTAVATAVQIEGCLATEVRNNIFTQCPSGVLITNGNGCIVADNMFESVTTLGIRYFNSNAVDGANIYNNVIAVLNSGTIGIQIRITGGAYVTCNNLTNNTIIGGPGGSISGIGILMQSTAANYVDMTGTIIQGTRIGMDCYSASPQVTRIKMPIATFINNTTSIASPLNLLSSNILYASSATIDVAGIDRVATDASITSVTGGINSHVLDVINTSVSSITFMGVSIPVSTHKLFVNLNGTWSSYS